MIRSLTNHFIYDLSTRSSEDDAAKENEEETRKAQLRALLEREAFSGPRTASAKLPPAWQQRLIASFS